MFGLSALLIKKQMKFERGIYMNVIVITIVSLLCLERVLKSEEYRADLHHFIILISMINCFKSYKSMKYYKAFLEQMNDQYKREMQMLKPSEDSIQMFPEFEEFMELNNGEPEKKIWNSKANLSFSILYFALIGTYTLGKLFQDYVLVYYDMINNIVLLISSLISTGYLIFNEQGIEECMNQDIRNFKKGIKKYTSENFLNLLDVKHEIRKESCHGDVSSKIQNSSKTRREISPEENKQTSINDNNITHEMEKCYISQETTHNKGETTNLNLNTSDCRTHETETDTTEKEETQGKSDNNSQVMRVLKYPTEPTAHMIKKDSEKDIDPGASDEDNSEKDIKQNEEQRNSVSDGNIVEQRENNNEESISSDHSTNEAETGVVGKADDNLQETEEQNHLSEPILNMKEKYSKKDIEQCRLNQGRTEEDCKQNWAQQSLVSEDIIKTKEGNNGKSSSSDFSIREESISTKQKNEASGKPDNILKGINEIKCPLEHKINMTERDSETVLAEGVSHQVDNEKDNKKNEAQQNSVSGENITQSKSNISGELNPPDPSTHELETNVAGKQKVHEKPDNNQRRMTKHKCPSELITNKVGKDSEKDINQGALNQDSRNTDCTQNWEQQNSINDEDIIEPNASNNGESISSESSTNKSEIGDEGKISGKRLNNKQVEDEQNCQSEQISNMTGNDSEEDIDLTASTKEHRRKDIKPKETQWSPFLDHNIIEKTETNNKKSSTSDFSTKETKEAETDVAGKEKTSEEADLNFQGVDEQNYPSEPVENMRKDSEKDIDLEASNQDHTEKGTKHNEEQKNSILDRNIIQQSESNNAVLNPSNINSNEAEADITEKKKTLVEARNRVQGMNEQQCLSKRIINMRGYSSEKDIFESASNQGHSEKDSKKNEAEQNSFPDDNITKRKKNSKGESSPSNSSIMGVNPEALEKESINLQRINRNKCLSEPVLNTIGTDSENVIDQGVLNQICSEEDSKQDGVQQNSIPVENIVEPKESKNGESNPSDNIRKEADTGIVRKEEKPENAHNNIQGMNEKKCPLKSVANVTKIVSEEDVDEGTSNQGRSEYDYKQILTQQISFPDHNITKPKENSNGSSDSSIMGVNNEASEKEGKYLSEPIINVLETDSKNLIDQGVLNQICSEEDSKEDGVQQNSILVENILEQKESKNGESNLLDPIRKEAETGIVRKEEKPENAHNNIQGMNEQKCPLKSVANITKIVSEEDVDEGTSNQGRSEYDYKQILTQQNSFPDHNITKPKENSNGSSDSSIMGVNNEASEKEGKCLSEPIINVLETDSKNLIDQGVLNQICSEEGSKQDGVQQNSILVENILEQKESKNGESNLLDPIRKEAETDIARKEERPEKAHNNIQGMNEQKCPLKSVANITKIVSEKDVDEGTSNQGRSENNCKPILTQQNSVADDNIIKREKSNYEESNPSDSSMSEANRNTKENKEASVKAVNKLQRVNKTKCPSGMIVNGTKWDSEKGIHQGASNVDHSGNVGHDDKDPQQNEARQNSALDDNVIEPKKCIRRVRPKSFHEGHRANRRNFGRRTLKDDKSERDVGLVSGRLTEAKFESNSFNKFSNKTEENIEEKNILNKTNEKCNPAEKCSFEEEGNTYTEKHIQKSVHSSECTKRDFQQNINITVSVNITKKFKSNAPYLPAEDTTEREDASGLTSVLDMSSVNVDSGINVEIGNTDDQKYERNLTSEALKYRLKSDQLEQSGSNTTEFSEGSGRPDMQTKGMAEQFMEFSVIEGDKMKENISEETSSSDNIASKVEADLEKRDDFRVEAETSKGFVPSFVTDIDMKRNDIKENKTIDLEQNREKTLDVHQKKISADSSQNLTHIDKTTVRTEYDKKTDIPYEVKENSNNLENVIEERSVLSDHGMKNKSDQAKENEFNSNLFEQKVKCTDAEEQGTLTPSRERITENDAETIHIEKRKKAKVPTEEIFFLGCDASNLGTGPIEKDSITTECGATQQSVHDFVAEDKRKTETNEGNVDGNMEHKKAQNQTIALDQITEKTQDDHKEEISTNSSQKLSHTDDNSVRTECDQGTDVTCEVKGSSNKLVNDIEEGSFLSDDGMKKNSDQAKENKFNSNLSEQKGKCTDAEEQVISTASMEGITENDSETIHVERSKNEKVTTEEVGFLGCDSSNLDKGPIEKESIVTECGATEQSVHDFVAEDKRKPETNVGNVDGNIKHKKALNQAIALDQKIEKIRDDHKEEISTDSSQKLSHTDDSSVRTEGDQGTDVTCEVKGSSNKLVNDIEEGSILSDHGMKRNSDQAKENEFSSNLSDQNKKCTDAEEQVISTASMEGITENDTETIHIERSKKEKVTTEEIVFLGCDASNLDKGPNENEILAAECSATKKSMHHLVSEDNKKYERNEVDVNEKVEHKNATKKKKEKSSKRHNIVRKVKGKRYQNSLISEVCHYHHEKIAHSANCYDSFSGNGLPVGKGKSLMTEQNLRRHEANFSVQGLVTKGESTSIESDYIKQNNEHHMICRDCRRRKDGKNCTVIIHNESMHLAFNTSKSFEIRCKFHPTCKRTQDRKSDDENQIC